MYRGTNRKQKNYFRTIISLYDIVCIKIAFVIMIVPFLNWIMVTITWRIKKVKQYLHASRCALKNAPGRSGSILIS